MSETKVVAEIIISAVALGESVSKYVKAAVEELHKVKGIRVITHAMGTNIEADNIDQVWEAAKKAHEKIFELGGKRVVTQIRIDDRRDKTRVMEDKIRAITPTFPSTE